MSSGPSTADSARHPSRRWVVYVMLLVLWLAWVCFRAIARPLIADEFTYTQLAIAPFGHFAYDHTPLYIHVLWALVHVFGLTPIQLRWFGIVTLGATAVVTFRVAERWARGAGWWALWLLLTNPLMVQGAMVIDVDQTLLTWWIITSVWLVACVAWPLSRRSVLLFGLWWALGLWIKETTPLLWPVALMCAALARGEGRRGVGAVTRMSAIGASVFVFAWMLYSTACGFPGHHIITHRMGMVLARGASHPLLPVVKELTERAVRIALWIGPLALGLWVVSTWRTRNTVRALPAREAWIVALTFGWGMLLGYWVIGGLIWSFPKYQCPFIPLLAAVAGVTITQQTRGARVSAGLLIVLTAAAFAWQHWCIGDLLYLVNHTLRDALLFTPGDVRQHLKELIMRAGWIGLGAGGLAGLLWSRRQALQLTRTSVITLALATGAIGSGLGMTTLQVTAPYSTTYCYGRPWAHYAALIRAVRDFTAAHPQAQVMAPFDVCRNAQVRWSQYLNEWLVGQQADRLVTTLTQPDVGLVIVDPYFSNAYFLTVVLRAASVHEVLAREYHAQSCGEATCWVRRSLLSHDSGVR